jgi:phage-related tail fiber protein
MIERYVHYMKFTVNTPGAVTVWGRYYTPAGRPFIKEDAGLTAATRAQAEVKDVYLITPANADAVALFLYEWYQKRTQQRFRMRMDGRSIGDNLDVATSFGARKTGLLTRADIDLTGGYLGECEVIG